MEQSQTDRLNLGAVFFGQFREWSVNEHPIFNPSLSDVQLLDHHRVIQQLQAEAHDCQGIEHDLSGVWISPFSTYFALIKEHRGAPCQPQVQQLLVLHELASDDGIVVLHPIY